MKKNKTWINFFMQLNQENQYKTMLNAIRELTVWLKAKGLYKSALKDTTSLKYFQTNMEYFNIKK